MHIQELLLPDARPAATSPVPLPRVVKIFRPDSETEMTFPDTGPPLTVRVPTRVPSPTGSLSGLAGPFPAPGGAVMIPGAEESLSFYTRYHS